MKRFLSVLAFIVLSSSTLLAQAPPDSATRASLVVQVRRSSDVVFPKSTIKTPVDSGRSHAMRNGAIIGATAGVIGGVVGSTFVDFGCLDTAGSPQGRSCSVAHTERVAAASLGVIGGLAGALVGAVTGKVVSLALR